MFSVLVVDLTKNKDLVRGGGVYRVCLKVTDNKANTQTRKTQISLIHTLLLSTMAAQPSSRRRHLPAVLAVGLLCSYINVDAFRASEFQILLLLLYYCTYLMLILPAIET
jgi:hypothetical protein